ncbi:MAG: hypothetical protein Q8M76_17245, partial [Spirochaetaceae bacterium]|nr:hypothetical protein [Spirochaetaceae bacterium]
ENVGQTFSNELAGVFGTEDANFGIFPAGVNSNDAFLATGNWEDPPSSQVPLLQPVAIQVEYFTGTTIRSAVGIAPERA